MVVVPGTFGGATTWASICAAASGGNSVVSTSFFAHAVRSTAASRNTPARADDKRNQPAATAPSAPAPAPAAKARKLSYKEQRELDGLPQQIAALEQEQVSIAAEMADGSLYVRDASRAAALGQRNAEIDDLLLQALERWEALGA